MAKNKAQIEIEVQNQQAIGAIQAIINGTQSINRELITAKYGFQTAFQTANQIMQVTTGQAQQLEKQILGLTGTFASLNSVFSAGVQLNDPLEKINALQPAIESSIAKVREISLTISGVTSSQLVDVFQTIATNSGSANLSLNDSVGLVKSFSAGLVSANIPLYQQRQEIDSILKGQITQDSTLAKQLGITNAIVEREKARSNLVGFLNERLKTSVVIQEKFSQTIEGAASNIQEIGELTQSAFGGQLLKPITDTLNAFYGFLADNKDKIFGFAQFLGNQFVEIGETLKVVFDAIAPRLAIAGELLGSLATTSIQAFTGAFAALGTALAVVDSALNVVLIPTLKILNTEIGQAIVIGGLFATVINVGAAGAVIKLYESLVALAVASADFVVLTGTRIAAVISEIGINGILNASLKDILATRTALASGQMLSSTQAGLAILGGGLITVAVAAAAALVAMSYFNKQNELFIEQNEKYSAMSDRAIDDSNKIVGSLKKLAEQRAKNGALTKEEEEQFKKQTQLSKIQVTENNSQIANLKVQISENGRLRETLEPKIKLLEKENEQLSKLQTSGLKVAEIGSAYAYLGQQAKAALNVIKAGVNQEVFDKRSKEVVDITKQQVELGLITRTQGIEQLEVVAKNEDVKVELRAAAQKQILALIKDGGKEELEFNKNQQAEIEQLQATGYLSEVDAIGKISALKKESLEIEANNTRKANKTISEETARERKSAIGKLEKELADANAAFSKGDEVGKANTLKNIEEIQNDILKANANFNNKEQLDAKKQAGDLAKIRADAAKAEQEEINKKVAALRGNLDRELEENGNLRKKAEFSIQADIQALKLGSFENDKQLEERTLLLKKQTIESELADKRRSLEFDKVNLANFVGSQAEKEKLIIQISKKELDIAKLNLDATDNLIARAKVLYDVKILSLEQEKSTLDKVSKLLQSQNDLQAARITLSKTIQDTELKTNEIKLNGLNEASSLLKGLNEEGMDDESKKAKQDLANNEKKILARQRLIELGFNASSNELEIARKTFEQEQKNLELKARQFESQQIAEQRTLKIQQQQAEIKDKQLVIEAKLAYFRALESGNEDQIKAALELKNLTEQQVDNNKKIAEAQTLNLAVKQNSERDAFNFSQGNELYKAKLQGVESGLSANEVINRGNTQTIKADKFIARDIPTVESAQKPLKANQDTDLKTARSQRAEVFGAVADGAVAFEDTTARIAENFDRLPASLKATKDGLMEVIDYAKELSENPIFKSREEQATKQEQTDRSNITNRLDGGFIEIKVGDDAQALIAKDNARKAKDAQDLQALQSRDKAQYERLGKDYERIVKDYESVSYQNKYAPINAKADRERAKRKRLEMLDREKGLFTGGIASIGEHVTVNEQGQEAATNLRTGETTLLPYGERQVIFGDTTYVHNANDTRQMLTANTSAAQSIADRNVEQPQNNLVLDALGKIHDLIAGREAKLAVTNNFTNEAQPDRRVYEVTRAIMRAVAV